MVLDFASGFFEDKSYKNSWDGTPDENMRTNEYFHYRDIRQHLDVLKLSAIGENLVSFAEAYRIKYILLEEMHENTVTIYARQHAGQKPGVVQHGRCLHAALLGHELRHAWQHLVCEPMMPTPQSAEEQILYDRFMEADARAIEFMLTVQCVSSMGTSNIYAENLIACLDDYQKRICLYSDKELLRLASEPAALKQATRQVFDQWIVRSPFQLKYDESTEEIIKLSQTGGLQRLFSRMGNVILGNSFRDSYPHYSKQGVSSEFIDGVVDVLGKTGVINEEENYLRDSKGLSFDNEFYTRICNYHLEKCTKSVDIK